MEFTDAELDVHYPFAIHCFAKSTFERLRKAIPGFAPCEWRQLPTFARAEWLSAVYDGARELVATAAKDALIGALKRS